MARLKNIKCPKCGNPLTVTVPGGVYLTDEDKFKKHENKNICSKCGSSIITTEWENVYVDTNDFSNTFINKNQEKFEKEQLKERVLNKVKKSKEIIRDIDGSYYWCSSSSAYRRSCDLRIIADKLDELNKEIENDCVF